MWNMFHFKVLDVALLSFDVFNVNYQDITNTNQLLPFHIFFKKVCAIFATYENKSPPLFSQIQSSLKNTSNKLHFWREPWQYLLFDEQIMNDKSIIITIYTIYSQKTIIRTHEHALRIYVLLICKQGQHIFHQTTNYHCRV